MSMTGSLMPFENNNDVNGKGKGGGGGGGAGGSGGGSKGKPQIQPKQAAGSVGSGAARSQGKGACFRAHLNSLWSVWYGLCATGLQGYIALQCVRRFLNYVELPWPVGKTPPRLELHACLGLTGAAILLLPFFLTSALLKIGNLANDGFKLGRHLTACTADPPSVLLGAGGGLGRRGTGVIRSLWQHGGPTAPFLHLATAFCLLLPKLLMEARLVHAGFLPKETIWRTDLDFVVVHRYRLEVMSLMNHTSPNFLPTPLPFVTSSIAAGVTLNVTTPHTGNTSALLKNLHKVTMPSQALSMAATLLNTTLATTLPSLSTASSLALRTVEDLVSETENHRWGPVSAEFLNYALALLVYAVRYPAVFWNTNKGFGALFSFQLLANGVQSLLAYAGMCVLYKVQVYGAEEALPLSPHRGSGAHNQSSGFLLNTHVTLALFILSNILVLASSLVLYLYGYGRFNAFLNQERERRVIILRDGRSGGGWGYFTHCAALCVLLAIAVCNAPILYDYTVVYRLSLDDTILVCVIGGILHLFLWVVVWLLLTIKQRWTFKLRVTIGRAAVKSARSVKLVTDVDLLSSRHYSDEGGSTAPLLVVGNGRTYTVADVSPKKAIMSVIQKAALERKAKASQNGNGGDCADEGEEQIYWLRPKPISPKTSPDCVSDRRTWLNRKLSGKTGRKHKVTFDDSIQGSGSRCTSGYKKGKSLLAKSPKCSGAKGKNKLHPPQREDIEQLSESEEDDGDYATLRELPLPQNNSEDTLSEENKLLDSALRDDTVTYARTNRDLNPSDYDDPTPLATPEPNDPDDLPPPPPVAAPVTVHTNNGEQHQFQGSVTPRCLRRADSGMPHDELTPRSDSVSTESSGSGGSPPCGNHSETSSGVHSNSSSEHHQQHPSGNDQEQSTNSRRSTSVDDLTTSIEQNGRVQPQWRSFSLQRNVLPPTSTSQAIMSQSNTNFGPPNGSVSSVMTNVLVQGQPIYAFGAIHPSQYNPQLPSASNCPVLMNGGGEMGGCPAVILETTAESTVVIRRKQLRPKTDGAEAPLVKEEPFGRSTNMRMTSFTDNPDGSRSSSSSATLPHYPTQPVAISTVYPHCSTMPLPSGINAVANHSANNTTGSGSCHSFPRPHTTIPTHHNGIRLFNGPNPFVKRFPVYHHQGMSNGRPPQIMMAPVGPYGTMPVNATPGLDAVRSNGITGHHTFPHVAVGIKYNPQNLNGKQDRDSANFSMASSGDSDQYLPHS